MSGISKETKNISIFPREKIILFIRLVYIKCRDDDGRFQSPPGMDNSVAAAVRRLAVVGRVLQCAMAETLWTQKRGRVTFR